MHRLEQDVRFGLRVLSGSPGFAAVAILTLGLGVACTTTVFSWIDGVMLHPYPGTRDSGRLASLEMITSNAPNGGRSVSWPDYRDYRDRLQTLAGLAVRRQSSFMLGDGEPARLVWGELVSGNYFEVMGVRARLGRTFTRAEAGDTIGAYPVIAISERLWRDYFHSDPAIAGKTVRVNRHPMTVIGVIPEGFRGGWPVMQYDLWAPVTMGPALGLLPESAFTDRGERGMLETICRLRRGMPLEQARAEAMALAGSLAAAFPKTNRNVGATVLPPWQAHDGVNELLRGPLLILLGLSFLVLLVVCFNVANLLLTRALGRRREFAIRFALGATRRRVALQLLIETLVLSFLGGGAGLLMMLWMQGSLVAMAPRVGFPLSAEVGWNARILGYTVLVCVAAALAAGISPALLAVRSDLNDVLKEGGRGGTAGRGPRRTRSVLVVAEMALAMVAVVAAGLFAKSFRNLRAINLGFETDHVLLGRFFIETTGYSIAEIEQFAGRLKQNLLTTEGVTAVAVTDFVPLSVTAGPYNNIEVEGYTPAPGESPAVNRAVVSPDYFAAVRIPLLEGRDFTEQDDRDAERVIVVNQAFARRYFGGGAALGRKVRVAGVWAKVVGVARDSKYYSPAEPPTPHLYKPFSQFYNSSPELYFLVRTARPAESAAAVLRRAVMQTDPDAMAFYAAPLADYLKVATFGERVAASLVATLGAICLLLAALGLYSVVSYSVTQRAPEIGIRLAMGATPGQVIRMVLAEGMALALAGVAAGTVVAILALGPVANALFGIARTDLPTFLWSGLFLGVVAVAATCLPAFRVTRIDAFGGLRR